jgi:hypothetical protein
MTLNERGRRRNNTPVQHITGEIDMSPASRRKAAILAVMNGRAAGASYEFLR